MTRRRDPAPFARLAALQELAVIERRRAVEMACAETDLCTEREAEMHRQVRAAEANLGDVHAADRLCPVRLGLAAAILGANEDALAAGRQALLASQKEEEAASLAWQGARHRVRWFAERARDLAKAEVERHDAAAEAEARSLDLALKGRIKG